MFNKPSQAEKPAEIPKKVGAIKAFKFEGSQDKKNNEQKAEDLSELVMQKVHAKMDALRAKTHAEETEIKHLIEAKFQEITQPNLKQIEQNQKESMKKAARLA